MAGRADRAAGANLSLQGPLMASKSGNVSPALPLVPKPSGYSAIFVLDNGGPEKSFIAELLPAF